MKFKKSYLLIPLVIIILLIPAYFFIFNINSVSIQNSSNRVKIIYNSNPTFQMYLKEWQIWDKNGVLSQDKNSFHTINRIQIENTEIFDKNKNFAYRNYGDPDKKIINMSTSYEIKDSILFMKIYLNPEFLRLLTKEQLNYHFLNSVMRTLNEARRNSRSNENENFGIVHVLERFYKEPDQNPFTVTPTNL